MRFSMITSLLAAAAAVSPAVAFTPYVPGYHVNVPKAMWNGLGPIGPVIPHLPLAQRRALEGVFARELAADIAARAPYALNLFPGMKPDPACVASLKWGYGCK
ncbi:hypothetical protein B0H21DRAFT_824619 [Amylocystis lapponica]|nr:hypothetical protein B0H21DRAFT_824619 [Amylocystis lapponica]